MTQENWGILNRGLEISVKISTLMGLSFSMYKRFELKNYRAVKVRWQ